MTTKELENSMRNILSYLEEIGQDINLINSAITDIEDLISNLKESDKETPTKPELISDGDYGGEPVYDMWKCPNCGKLYEIDYDVYDYCPNCGQHIDRSEMDE